MPIIEFQSIITGEAQGHLFALRQPISFWGGTDQTGTITEPQHSRCGESFAGTILVMPPAKGSTAGPGALVELLVSGNGPCAVLLNAPDMVPVIASEVSRAVGGPLIPVGLLKNDGCDVLTQTQQLDRHEPPARIIGNRCYF